MTTERPSIERRIRISGIMVIVGLIIELITLLWAHPTAFIVFLIVGGVAVIAGISYYLLSLISIGDSR